MHPDSEEWRDATHALTEQDRATLHTDTHRLAGSTGGDTHVPAPPPGIMTDAERQAWYRGRHNTWAAVFETLNQLVHQDGTLADAVAALGDDYRGLTREWSQWRETADLPVTPAEWAK
tara:strand:- start:7673 stop:8026 length:354 start_codon:yes stop_codon:yes gene_type:complete